MATLTGRADEAGRPDAVGTGPAALVLGEERTFEAGRDLVAARPARSRPRRRCLRRRPRAPVGSSRPRSRAPAVAPRVRRARRRPARAAPSGPARGSRARAGDAGAGRRRPGAPGAPGETPLHPSTGALFLRGPRLERLHLVVEALLVAASSSRRVPSSPIRAASAAARVRQPSSAVRAGTFARRWWSTSSATSRSWSAISGSSVLMVRAGPSRRTSAARPSPRARGGAPSAPRSGRHPR